MSKLVVVVFPGEREPTRALAHWRRYMSRETSRYMECRSSREITTARSRRRRPTIRVRSEQRSALSLAALSA